MKRLFLVLLPILLLIACDPARRAAQTADDGQISFKVLHINDVYEIAPLEGGKAGGMARVARLYDQLRAEGEPVLFVHAGDFLNPSLLGNLKFAGERIKGRQMVEVMNAAGIDLVTFGNHEFDLDMEDLQKRLNESDFTWLATNVYQVVDGAPQPFHRMSEGERIETPQTYTWTVTDADGTSIQVGFFGATIGSNPRDYVHYDDPYREATKAAEQLAANCDLVLGLTHLEMVQDLKLAGMLDDVPLLMGGHDHDNIRDQVGETLVCKADANAKTAYVYSFTYNTQTGDHTLEAELIDINTSIEFDPEVDALVAKWNTIQDDVIGEVVDNPHLVVYRTSEPLDGRESSIRNQQTNMGEVITAAIDLAARKELDAAFFNAGSVRIDDQVAGDITAVDVFRILPFGGSIVEADMTGELLLKILDAGQENQGTGGYLQLRRMARKGGTWHINDAPIDPNAVYHIGFTDFLLTGLETRLDFMTPDNPGFITLDRPDSADASDLRADIRKAVIQYLAQK